MSEPGTLDNITVQGRRVLVRADLNVPMRQGKVLDLSRIERAAPTVRELAEKGARVLLTSHFGRSKALHDLRPDLANDTPSLKTLLDPLRQVLGRSVSFSADLFGEDSQALIAGMQDGDILLLENLHAWPGEIENDPDFARDLASLAEIYVMDAFSCTDLHHASVVRLPLLLPTVYGRMMQRELDTLSSTLSSPDRPVMAIVGGAKVSARIALLEELASKVDMLVVGGGIANTFLHAMGHEVGHSLCEPHCQDQVKKVLTRARASGCDLLLPVDVVIARAMTPDSPARKVGVKSVPADAMILDTGPASTDNIIRRMGECRTVVWTGPLGAYEMPPYDQGTKDVATAIVERTRKGRLRSIAGGAATVAALSRAGLGEGFTCLSLAGGAFLEWLEGHELPGLKAIRQSPR